MDGVSHDSADAWRREHEESGEDHDARSFMQAVAIGLVPFIIGIVLFAVLIKLSQAAL